MPFSLINLTLGLLILTGLLFGIFASRLGLPRVAAYVVAGMVFSPDFLGRIHGIGGGEWTEPLTTFALGIIAYLIGGSITLIQMKRMGRIIMGTTLGESFGAAIFVFIVMLLVAPQNEAFSITSLALAFAAVSAATDPATTIAVLHQYRANGPVSSTLLGVVAIDDAIGIILFSLMIVITGGETLEMGLGMGIYKILGSFLLGLCVGRLLPLFLKHFHQGGFRMPVILGSILLTLGCAEALGLAHLLAAMTLGFSARSFSKASGDRLFGPIDYFEELIFIVFFTVAGAHFEMRVLLGHVHLVLAYFVARIGGKIAGASLGALVTKAPRQVKRWVGFGLIPQAGVSVGLALTLSHQPMFKPVSSMIINVVLGSTILFELTGPLVVRLALERAGELGEKRERGKA